MHANYHERKYAEYNYTYTTDRLWIKLITNWVTGALHVRL